ncbi:MAG: DNRLRE domain-containing protein [Ignavibacteriae bacterium]|nr:DNRLRE domain-containing protein [Ignavibacteriota bacterium]
MKQQFSFFLFLILIFSIWLGCSDDPNSVGIGLLPPQDSVGIRTLTTIATLDTSYLSRIMGGSTRQLVGMDEGIEARAIIQFSGIPTDAPNAIIDTAILRFPITYRFKDSVGEFGLHIRRMIRSWTKDSLTWDSTNVPTLVSTVDDTSFLKNITVLDSTIEMRVDAVVRKWFHDTLKLSSPYGIVLIPTSTSNIIIGASTVYVSSTDSRPELYISYRSDTNTSRSTLTLKPFQQVFVANGSIPLTTDSLFYLQAGIAYRGKLHFDLSLIPKQASITAATLQLSLEKNQSLRNSQTSNSFIAHLDLDGASPPKLSSLTATGSFASDTATIISLDVKTLVQQLASKKVSNNGFVIRAGNEFISADRYAFYSNVASDSTLRPQLKITYTILP